MYKVDMQGFSMVLQGDNYLEEQIIRTGSWEPATTAVFRQIVRPGMTVVDVGANIGYFSLLSASLVGVSGQVHAFEPYPGYQKRLKASLGCNDFPQIRLIPFALSDKVESHELYKGLASARMHKWQHENPAFAAVQDTVTVRCLPLDEYAARYLQRMDVLKIDVDGYEMNVLRGGRESICKHKPVVIIEVCQETLADAGVSSGELLELFRELDYVPFSEEGVRFSHDELLRQVLSNPKFSLNVIFKPGRKAAVKPTESELKIITANSVEEFRSILGLDKRGYIYETDLNSVNNDLDRNGRKIHDAEVLTTLAANIDGNALDIGTSHGRSAFKIGSNLAKNHIVHTVNALPEQLSGSNSTFITHQLSKEQIGLFYREKGLQNVVQHYADTSKWNVPDTIKDVKMVFVDGAHDTEAVYTDSKWAYELLENNGYIIWHDFAPALRKKHDWIDACMKGVERFVAETVPDAEIVHLRDSFMAVLRKTAKHAICEETDGKPDNVRLGVVLDLAFHQQNRWVSATTGHFVQALLDQYACRVIGNQQDYETQIEQCDALISMEPGWCSPKIDYTRTPALREAFSRIPTYIYMSDPHAHAWRQDYFLQHGFDFLLSFYWHPMLHHFRKIDQRQIVHLPWAIPDQWISDDPVHYHGQKNICCFGGQKGESYDLRNWCREFPFVESAANSGCENKVMTEAEYLRWLGQKDACIAAGSDSISYRLTVPKYFEIAAAGALLFAQETDDLGRLGFEHNRNCIIFNRSNFEAFAREYLAAPEKYLEMRERGRELIRQRHTLSVRLRQLDNHLQQSIQSKSGTKASGPVELKYSAGVSELTDRQYWDRGRSNAFRPWKVANSSFAPVLENYLPADRNLTCVELGAYPGGHLCYLAKRFGYRPTAVEFSEHAEHIGTLLQYNGIDRYTILQQDVFAPIEQRFDVVASFGFVEHFENYEAVIDRHFHLLKPGGYVVIGCPYLDNYQGMLRQLVYRNEKMREILKTHNRRIMNLDELKRIVAKHNVKICHADFIMGNNIWIDSASEDIKPEMRWLVDYVKTLNDNAGHLLPSSKLYSPMLLLVAQDQSHVSISLPSPIKKIPANLMTPIVEKKLTLSNVDVGIRAANELKEVTEAKTDKVHKTAGKKKVLVFVDKPGWAHDFKTDQIARYLGDEFEFKKHYCDQAVCEGDIEWADLIVIYYWRMMRSQSLKQVWRLLEQNRHKVLMGICSHVELEGELYELGLRVIQALAGGGVFANSRLLYNTYAHHFDVPVYYTPNGVDTTFFTPSDCRVENQMLTVGWAGSLTTNGGGKGYHEFIVPAAKAAGVKVLAAAREDCWRTQEQMLEFYRKIDVYVCASLNEGTPNPCLEAASCGVPILTTRVGNMPELICPGVNGYFVERNVSSIADKLNLLSGNRLLLDRLRSNARRCIVDWDWSAQAENYRRMFRTALAANSPSDQLFSSRRQVYLASADRMDYVLRNAESLQKMRQQKTDNFVSVIGGLSGLNYLAAAEPKRITFFDINGNAIEYARLIVELIRISNCRQDFISRVFGRSVRTFLTDTGETDLTCNNQNQYLERAVDASLVNETIGRLSSASKTAYQTYLMPAQKERVLEGIRNCRCLLPCFGIHERVPVGGGEAFGYNEQKQLVPNTNSFFYGFGWLANEMSFDDVRQKLSGLPVSYVPFDLLNGTMEILIDYSERTLLHASNIDDWFRTDWEKWSRRVFSEMIRRQGDLTVITTIGGVRTMNADPHVKAYAAVAPYVYGQTIEVTHKVPWGFHEFKRHNVRYSDYLQGDFPADTTILHILAGEGLGADVFEAVCRKAVGQSGRVLVLEHNSLSADWPAETAKRFLSPEDCYRRLRSIAEETGGQITLIQAVAGETDLCRNMLFMIETPATKTSGHAAGSQSGEDQPLVSVIMPTYNRPEMLKYAIASVLNQTYSNIEMIVVNDAGNPVDAVVTGLNMRGNIVSLRHETNKGLGAARNTGLRAARGKYICYLDDDDMFFRDHVKTLVTALETSEFKAAHANAVRSLQVKKDGKYVEVDRTVPYTRPVNHDDLLVQNMVPVLCVMHAKTCIEKTGFFDETLKTHEDWDFWIRMSKYYPFLHVPEITSLVSWRQDGTTMSSSKQEEFRRIPERMYARYRDWAIDKPDVLARQSARLRMLGGQAGGIPAANVQPATAVDVPKTIEPGGSAPARKYKIAIKFCTPSHKLNNWGDTWFARGLQRAFIEGGHDCVIHSREEWDQPDDDIDIAIHLKGLAAYKPKPHCFNVIWLISHPELHTPEELNQFDAVFCGSKKYLEHIKPELKVPIRYLPQAADTTVFGPIEKASTQDIDLLFVGSNYYQNKNRRIIADVLATGQDYNLWIVGPNWKGHVPDKYVKGQYVLPEKLAELYARTKIVLNDHHDTMRQWGFVNDRTYSLAASNMFQISDDVQGIEELGVVTYQTPEDLREKIDFYLAHEAERLQAAALVHERCKGFSFAQVAQQILDGVGEQWTIRAGKRERGKMIETAATLTPASAPKVSVIMSCHNAAKYLAETMDTLLAQTFKDWELLAVDDAGTDGTLSMLKRYAEKDSRIRLWQFDEKRGPYLRRNFAIRQARSEFICIQDADDLMHPEKLEALYECIRQNPQLAIVGSHHRRFRQAFRGEDFADPIQRSTNHTEIMEAFKQTWQLCWHGSAIIRKSLFDTIGLYDEQPYGSDSFWLAKAGLYSLTTRQVEFRNIPRFLTYKREHSHSQTGTISPADPRNRRHYLEKYYISKLTEIAQNVVKNPDLDAAAALKACTCTEFIPVFGHMFETWESQPVTEEMCRKMLERAAAQFAAEFYVSCLITLDRLDQMTGSKSAGWRHLNLMEGLAAYASGEDSSAAAHLRKETNVSGPHAATDLLKRLESGAVPSEPAQRRREIKELLAQYKGAIGIEIPSGLSDLSRTYPKRPVIATSAVVNHTHGQQGEVCRR